MRDSLFILAQHLLPQHLLSRVVGCLAESRLPLIKNTFIQRFAARYGIDMSEAAEPNLLAYENFNAFFTRALKAGARPIAADAKAIACPADGAISEIGPISDGRVLQAKGRDYSLTQLLGGDPALAERFYGGQFATVYLSPRDYHRVHMPFGGTLERAIYVPGDLYSVNQTTADNVDSLFARNERLVCLFQTELGPMAVILVGAMIVAGIETVWSGQVAPVGKVPQVQHFPPFASEVKLDKGAEMGRFKLGSTAIVLFGPGVMEWDASLANGSPVRMGQAMGQAI